MEHTGKEECGRKATGRTTSHRLVLRKLLDPRPEPEASRRPIQGAVNIPLAEIPRRTYELPPRSEVIRVAGPQPLVSETVAWLERNGRRGEVETSFTYEHTPSLSEVGRLWQPTAFLTEVLPQLASGTAIDLACGTGRDVVYLAAQQWDVTGVDVLPDALERGRELAGRYTSALRPIRWLQHDLEADPLTLDRRFDLITIFRYLHRPLLARLGEWLKPGGSVVCETFTTLHRQRHGRPTRDEHVLESGELPTLLNGFEFRHYSEAWRGSAHTARICAVDIDPQRTGQPNPEN